MEIQEIAAAIKKINEYKKKDVEITLGAKSNES